MVRSDRPWRPIGHVRSPWPEKFGVPRQAGLTSAHCLIELDPDLVPAEALRGLDGFSHLWVLFVFHRIPDGAGRPTVRPPRLGGNARIGTLASRSGFRPNRIGLSAVRLVGIEGPCLRVAGGDFVDGTPVIDIKPYLPWSDSIADARAAWSDAPPPRHAVRFSEESERQLAAHPRRDELRPLIVETLALDPRPAYQRDPSDRVYGMRLLDVDVRFTRNADEFVVWAIVGADALSTGLGNGRQGDRCEPEP
jgi:tRNA (adenine37-N6)-methyltransferase